MKKKRKRSIRIILCIFIIFFCFINITYALNDLTIDGLATARTLVENGHYEKALKIYHKALAKNPKNTDLLIETARVEGWAGHNEKSAELYERVLKVDPERRYDVLPALGWQLLWTW
jgi:tetratricopeptide (TPR) repeat protein